MLAAMRLATASAARQRVRVFLDVVPGEGAVARFQQPFAKATIWPLASRTPIAPKWHRHTGGGGKLIRYGTIYVGEKARFQREQLHRQSSRGYLPP